VHELADLVGQDLRGDNVATTSGWVTQRLGGFPKAGDVLSLGGYVLRVERTDGMRVARLKLTRQPEPPNPAM
jgi:CBS domain containing-hemolysin-like protein